jgi:hypothetical protein
MNCLQHSIARLQFAAPSDDIQRQMVTSTSESSRRRPIKGNHPTVDWAAHYECFAGPGTEINPPIRTGCVPLASSSVTWMFSSK